MELEFNFENYCKTGLLAAAGPMNLNDEKMTAFEIYL
jgi:hypothetical protein